MLRRMASRLSYANVMATIAVFLALGGGGYAALAAIEGSGRGVFGGRTGFDGSTSTFEPILTVPGVVSIKGSCDANATSSLLVKVTNISGRHLVIHRPRDFGEPATSGSLSPNGGSATLTLWGPGGDTQYWHVFRPHGDTRPMVGLTVSGLEGQGCADSVISAQGLSSKP